MESIHISSGAAQPMVSLREVRAIAGQGLEGDRYAVGRGTYSPQPGAWSQVTLIEAEALEALRRELGLELSHAGARRNIVTRGVPLNHYVERQFWVGQVLLRGSILCEPCGHLARLTHRNAAYGLLHRGGLRADILTGGVISVGDSVRVEQDEAVTGDRVRGSDRI